MRLLVTGATGFIGRHLVRRLAEQHELFCMVRTPKELPLGMARCTIIEDGLSRSFQPDVKGFPSRLDGVIHLAQTRTPFPEQAREFFAGSTGYTHELLDYSRKVEIRNFIYASSGSVYGFGPKPFHEEDLLQLDNFYAVNKRCSELLVKAYSKFFHSCVLRLFFPYGPSQHGRRISLIAERVTRGQPVDVANKGQPRINPIYVDDVVRIIEAALGIEGSHIVNVAGDEIVNMMELAELVGELVGRRPSFEHSTEPNMSDLIGNNELMHRLFGLREGELVPLRKGLRYTVAEILSREEA